ncbi:lysosome-associated membrane glycoprotein 2-like [Melitaea cinxia]|uniref:lysosome-associated membrane glycoprotein 2-like n=1 Tax=Melitaea cinxia TaxID=113334 RepID=UPI001E2748E0|nr:lysosome-associated membrane glycoprotein 2-like [Melitaea cinxia]
MTRLRLCLLAAVLCSLTVLGHGSVTTQKPVTILLPKTVSSESPSPEPEVTTVDVKTTEVSTQPPETTSAPTTTPPTTTSTTTTTTSSTTPTPPPTPKPTPPPTPKPTPAPTPAPGPIPPPKQGIWSYTDKLNNNTCVLLQFAAQLNVTYTKVENASTSLAYVILNVPTTAVVVNGSCNGTDQWLNIRWPVNNATDTTYNNMVFIFHNNETTKMYSLRNLNVLLAPEAFPNASSKEPIELWHGEGWKTPLATSYRCTPATQLNMTADSTSMVATLTLSQLQEEAFRNSTNKSFSAARECGGSDVPDAVPIAVGCALGGLVLVVLVAYLVGRRRSAARGYLSM